VTRQAAIVLLVSAVLVVGGCAPAGSPEPPTAPSLDEATQTQLLADQRDSRWADVLGLFPTAARPDTEIVRLIRPNEWAETQAGCLQEQSFDVTAGADGGLRPGSIPDEQQEALAVAMYLCDASYPIDPSKTLPLSNDELSYIYDYFVEVLTPCLEAAGVDVPAPSSRAMFLETYDSGAAWNPYVHVPSTTGLDWAQVNQDCPQYPVDFRN
jgi:hypothetical protein